MTYFTTAALKQTHSGPLTDPPINSFANIRFQERLGPRDQDPRLLPGGGETPKK